MTSIKFKVRFPFGVPPSLHEARDRGRGTIMWITPKSLESRLKIPRGFDRAPLPANIQASHQLISATAALCIWGIDKICP